MRRGPLPWWHNPVLVSLQIVCYVGAFLVVRHFFAEPAWQLGLYIQNLLP